MLFVYIIKSAGFGLDAFAVYAVGISWSLRSRSDRLYFEFYLKCDDLVKLEYKSSDCSDCTVLWLHPIQILY